MKAFLVTVLRETFVDSPYELMHSAAEKITKKSCKKSWQLPAKLHNIAAQVAQRKP